ncbi:hypothetical protein ACFQQB_29310 [Nonomuraea rubra]|uniref:hypothetical protein n=1 Tax=Nonomuraea rubra TaxID=46180 RepID=UPI00360E811D
MISARLPRDTGAMELAEWCARWLGAAPVGELFRAGHLSVVRGLELADGRRVVVKCRVADEARVRGCVGVQRHLAGAGFPRPARRPRAARLPRPARRTRTARRGGRDGRGVRVQG